MQRLPSRILFVAAFCLSCKVPANAQDATRQASRSTIDISSHVAEASQRFGLPQYWIYAVIRTESAGRIRAVSSAGAMGLMQLMPETWARQRTRFGLGLDPFDPRDNIMAGTSYLREMYDSYGSAGFLAAYNAGPGRYEQYRDEGRPLPSETRAYVTKIATALQTASPLNIVANASSLQPARLSWTQSQMFAVRKESGEDAPASATVAAPLQPLSIADALLNGLFVPVSGRRPR